MAVLTTTLPGVPNRRVAEVLGVVLGEGEGALAAFAAMEELGLEYEADAIIDVRTTTAAAAGGAGTQCRAQYRVIVIGTAVRLDAEEVPA